MNILNDMNNLLAGFCHGLAAQTWQRSCPPGPQLRKHPKQLKGNKDNNQEIQHKQ